MLLGYARTITTDQHAGLEAQVRDLKAAGAEKVLSEQVCSVAHGTALQASSSSPAKAMLLMVTRPDRLARSHSGTAGDRDRPVPPRYRAVVLSMGGEKLDTRNPT